ncbi:zinc finger BED domain-containing protein RICESLEEPER 1-like [Arachis hypogaea]|uniref:zinc finger BED domain-containing protein RICESLEEPER 1-like n=1 Tax=Arachis hypogaea TaxID=3818 RepID=UPI003B20F99D
MVMKEFRELDCETQTSKDKDELEIYLKESLIYTNEDDLKYDVLNFLKINGDRFFALSVMARDVLSILIIMVASESAFSIGGCVLTKYRSSTLHEHVQMLICTRSWLHGFVPNHDDNKISKIHEERSVHRNDASSSTFMILDDEFSCKLYFDFLETLLMVDTKE